MELVKLLVQWCIDIVLILFSNAGPSRILGSYCGFSISEGFVFPDYLELMHVGKLIPRCGPLLLYTRGVQYVMKTHS